MGGSASITPGAAFSTCPKSRSSRPATLPASLKSQQNGGGER